MTLSRLVRAGAGVLSVALLAPACADADTRNPGVEVIANALAAAESASTNPLSIVAEVVNGTGGPAVRFYITNVTFDAQEIDQADLPWSNDWAVQVTGLTMAGTVLPIVPKAGSRISDGPVPTILNPGQRVFGDIPLKYLFSADTIGQPVLLLWTYSQNGRLYTGMARLPAR